MSYQGPYSQNLIFFVTYEWAQYVSVLHHTKLEKIVRDKLSSLLGLFVSYEENEMFWIRSLIFPL